MNPGPWVDPGEGFDYGCVPRELKLPPILWIAATRDQALGHPDDVRRTMAEVGFPEQEVRLLPGLDHITMLTDPAAAKPRTSPGSPTGSPGAA